MVDEQMRGGRREESWEEPEREEERRAKERRDATDEKGYRKGKKCRGKIRE